MDQTLLEQFQKKIDYKFFDESLLRTALTHSSYANERKINKIADYERLEFLGDAVLEFVSSEYLFLAHPDMKEGEMTRLRASMVCEVALSYCSSFLDIGKYMFLGKGEDESGGRKRPSVCADMMEAVIGAIYLDGGISPAKKFIMTFILNDLEDKKLFYDAKTILQEEVQKKPGRSLRYEVIAEEGPEHNKYFTVRLFIDEQEVSRGSGHSKKAAEQEAAYKALLSMKGRVEGNM